MEGAFEHLVEVLVGVLRLFGVQKVEEFLADDGVCLKAYMGMEDGVDV